ncbi:TlpA disulfide reductase family protein [Chitinophaga cymbidii]|nr:TlpA disulfide reductase family protein [Chitinophaga cymbidii]
MMTKIRTIGVFSMLTFSIAATAQESFELKGTVTEAKENGMVMLSYNDGTRFRYDTTRVRNHSFSLTGKILQPGRSMLYIEHITKQDEAQYFFLTGGTTSVKGKRVGSSEIEGGKAQSEYNLLLDQWKNVGWEPLSTSEKSKSVKMKKDSVSLAFLKSYPSSPVSFWLMEDLATASFIGENREKVAPVYEKMDSEWRASKNGKKIAGLLETAKKLGVGMPAIDFTMNDTLGKPVRLADFRGKYVLLDFWASWCVPCRGENPNVVKAWQKYKDRNFTVIGVSLDKESDKQKWINAIHMDDLTWTHLSDLKGWDNAAARAYEVRSIPMNYLIDPQGKIIGVALRGNALGEKLEEILQ